MSLRSRMRRSSASIALSTRALTCSASCSGRGESSAVDRRARPDAVMDGMKDEIGEMAILIAEQVIKKNIEPQIQGELIDELIQNVGDSQWQK